MDRTALRALPALLLLVPLAACGEDDPATGSADPLGNGVVWRDGSEVHFPGGEVVDAGLEATSISRTSHGVVASGWGEGSVYVTPDGTVTELDLPADAKVSTEPGQSLVAWMTTEPGDGVVHVLDPATGEEHTAVKTDYDDAMSLALDGDTVWLYSNELNRTLEIDWRSGKVTKVPVEYVRTINGRYATVEGGNENYVQAGAAKPGIIDLETRKLVRRGWDWAFSPAATYATTTLGDGGASTQDTRIGVLDIDTGKFVARLPAVLREGGWLNWAWTPDERSIYWFEGSELVVCEVATADCTRDEVDAQHPDVA